MTRGPISRRWLLPALTALALAVPFGGATASASSVGCTFAEGPVGSYMCLTINGSSTYVRTFRVTYQKYGQSICYGTAKVVVTTPTGTKYTYGPKATSGTCNWHNSWVDFGVYRHFPHKSRVCGYFYERGKSVGGPACNYIYK